MKDTNKSSPSFSGIMGTYLAKSDASCYKSEGALRAEILETPLQPITGGSWVKCGDILRMRVTFGCVGHYSLPYYVQTAYLRDLSDAGHQCKGNFTSPLHATIFGSTNKAFTKLYFAVVGQGAHWSEETSVYMITRIVYFVSSHTNQTSIGGPLLKCKMQGF